MYNKAKINYQIRLDYELSKINGIMNQVPYEEKPTLLLHSCCGPCSSYVLEYLVPYFDITVFYYNPCIYPSTEYELRKDVQKSLIRRLNEEGKKISFVDESRLLNDQSPEAHDKLHEKFLEKVKGHEEDPECGERCHICYEQRLVCAAKYAAKNKYDYFTTTLTVSPYKNADFLNELGDRISHEYDVRYLFSDFKKREGYKRSIELSKEYDLYRQNYCGCEFSIAKID